MSYHMPVYGYEVIGVDRADTCAKAAAINWTGIVSGSYPRLWTEVGGAGNCEIWIDAAKTNHVGGINISECFDFPTYTCSGMNAGSTFVPSYWTAPGSAGGGGSSSTELVPPDIFNISPQGGAQIALAILAVWAVGWAFKAFIRTLKHTDGGSSSSESE